MQTKVEPKFQIGDSPYVVTDKGFTIFGAITGIKYSDATKEFNYTIGSQTFVESQLTYTRIRPRFDISDRVNVIGDWDCEKIIASTFDVNKNCWLYKLEYSKWCKEEVLQRYNEDDDRDESGVVPMFRSGSKVFIKNDTEMKEYVIKSCHYSTWAGKCYYKLVGIDSGVWEEELQESPAPKFKPGDLVAVRAIEPETKTKSVTFVQKMIDTVNRSYIVKSYTAYNNVELYDNGWIYDESWLKPVQSVKEDTQPKENMMVRRKGTGDWETITRIHDYIIDTFKTDKSCGYWNGMGSYDMYYMCEEAKQSQPLPKYGVDNTDVMTKNDDTEKSEKDDDQVLKTHNDIMAVKMHEAQHEALSDVLDGALTDKMDAAIRNAIHAYLGDKLKEIDYFMDKQRNENINTAKRITNTREMQEKLYKEMTQKIHNALSSAHANKEKIRLIEKAIQDCVSNDRAFTSDMSDFKDRVNEHFDRMHERHDALDSKVDIHKESSDKHLVALQTQLSNVKRDIANMQGHDEPQWI